MSAIALMMAELLVPDAVYGCSICFGDFSPALNVVALKPCHHVFHEGCINTMHQAGGAQHDK